MHQVGGSKIEAAKINQTKIQLLNKGEHDILSGSHSLQATVEELKNP